MFVAKTTATLHSKTAWYYTTNLWTLHFMNDNNKMHIEKVVTQLQTSMASPQHWHTKIKCQVMWRAISWIKLWFFFNVIRFYVSSITQCGLKQLLVKYFYCRVAVPCLRSGTILINRFFPLKKVEILRLKLKYVNKLRRRFGDPPPPAHCHTRRTIFILGHQNDL